MESYYDDEAAITRFVADGKHRETIGGLWDELGDLQFSFLVEKGLRPGHALLDVGCGALRGGVRFVPYLDEAHYFGVDTSRALLDAGLVEIDRIGCSSRLPPENLLCVDDFDFAALGRKFDFAIAQSVFTHLSFNRIRRCLEQICDVMVDNGVFYATFFERPAENRAREPVDHQPGGVRTNDARDPYHYSLEDMRYAAQGLPLSVEYVGDWSHPRGQRIVAFHRKPSAGAAPQEIERSYSAEQAAGLSAGANHYRAYVGPPNRFDFMSATQFNLLITLGLREGHSVLDLGCGSLRLGRLLIPFLQPGKYHGIDPNQWLIDDGIRFELGADSISIKRPRFSFNDDFNLNVFGRTFDFVMAQSILTHCGPELFQTVMSNAGRVLAEDGVFVFSYCEAQGRAARPGDGWVYPDVVHYSEAEVRGFAGNAGLAGRALPWFHPGASWYATARSTGRLPGDDELRFLRGAVLHDPQFAASRI